LVNLYFYLSLIFSTLGGEVIGGIRWWRMERDFTKNSDFYFTHAGGALLYTYTK